MTQNNKYVFVKLFYNINNEVFQCREDKQHYKFYSNTKILHTLITSHTLIKYEPALAL